MEGAPRSRSCPGELHSPTEAPRLGERTMLCCERMAPTTRQPRSPLT
jgi:hypothetical protein